MGLPLDLGALQEAAFRGSVTERGELAAMVQLPPELLYFLTGDAAPSVRLSAAGNPALPALADKRLAADPDPAVRAVLGRRLGQRAAQIMATDVPCASIEALWILARDVEVEVRFALADALADMPDAPRDLVLLLARDPFLAVCEPLLRLSQVLGEADLLDLVNNPGGEGTRAAIAGRLRLSEAVCLAMIHTGDETAVVALLRNHTAQIPPAGLEIILEGARSRVPWQDPLATRPHLPIPMLEQLVSFMAEEVLQQLVQRFHLPAMVAARARERLAPRIGQNLMVWADTVTYSS
jgi:uncharacterized protein (DUF2336 family)